MSEYVIKNVPCGNYKEKEDYQKFIDMLRSGLEGTPFRISKQRGRGPRRETAMAHGLHPTAYDQDLPVEYSTTATVYIDWRDSRKARIARLLEQRRSYSYVKWMLDKELNRVDRMIEELSNE